MIVTLKYAERNVYEFQEQKQIYRWEDLIAGIGGMIGFCWFLILSLAEIFIYFSLKVTTIRNLVSKKTKMPKGEKNQETKNKKHRWKNQI